MKHLLSILIFSLFFNAVVQALPNPEALKRNKAQALEIRENCAPATAKTEIKVNNVRAMLQNGGDVWWDRTDGRYYVPNVSGIGAKPVSSIYAAAVWIGGKDEAGNLKLAAKTYGKDRSDFWPGPLDDVSGQISKTECKNWDRFFEVSRDEVDESRRRYEESITLGIPYSESEIPSGVLNWPAKGNPFFRKNNKWELPSTTANLAPFFDNPTNPDGLYNPLDGDYPIIEVRGIGGQCYKDIEYQANPAVADQMIFWIYNDNAGAHAESGGIPIQMEVQVQAFAFSTGDALNDMTFMRYKLVNRAPVPITECYFGWWVDADLGCPYDDYVGCDTTRSLVYYYNQDAEDGNNGTICNSGGSTINTYKDKIPIVGIDYFEGPTKPVEGQTEDIDIGMTAFMYYNNSPGDNTRDPNVGAPEEFYNLLRAYWVNGRPLVKGGNGYAATGGVPTNYAFPSDPNQSTGWSMCNTDGFQGQDRRTIQSTGPITLLPNKTNFLVVGVPWVPNQKYPCPPLDELRRADDICQGLFDNCFKIFDGPDAPQMDVIELDRKLVFALTYPATYNNSNLDFAGYNPGYSPSKADSALYKFEGYQIYQLVDPSAVSTLDDATRARLVAQVDKKNNVAKLYNWQESNYTFPGTSTKLLTPVLMVEGENKGLRNVFEINNDAFSTGADVRLVNHKEYYYTVVAYATNNFKDYNPTETDPNKQGQRLTFARGRRHIEVKNAVPRPINDKFLHANVGDGGVITRLDGQGNYGIFLDMENAERDRIIQANINNNFDCHITYKESAGPLNVKIYNPLDVKDGNFTLTFSDNNMSDGSMDDASTTWKLVDQEGKVLVENEQFDLFNEKLIADYGFSIFFNQDEPGTELDGVNGNIGQLIDYRNKDGLPWLGFQLDQADLGGGIDAFNFIKPSTEASAANLDPNNAFENGLFLPYLLTMKFTADRSAIWDITPAPIDNQVKQFAYNISNLSRLNNVDIVLTSDKNLWSRCVVVETSNDSYAEAGYNSELNRKTFQLRGAKSISKDVDANGNPVQEDTEGFSWFPGYAIDVETGKRLNIFFGENSSYNETVFGAYLREAGLSPKQNVDMIWNPSGIQFFDGINDGSALYAYGQHFVYVTDRAYDGCDEIGRLLKGGGNQTNRGRVSVMTTWVGLPAVTDMKSYAEGLIPEETTIKLRVNNAYQTSTPACENQGMPKYNIQLIDKGSLPTNDSLTNAALDMINVVPNPYYAYSSYEKNEISDIVKITNLPAKCEINIYSLDGKFIRHFNRNVSPEQRTDPTAAVRFRQIYPDLEWDLKNSRGITVASGVYLIHVKSDQGERVIKWVGAIRQLEISGF